MRFLTSTSTPCGLIISVARAITATRRPTSTPSPPMACGWRTSMRPTCRVSLPGRRRRRVCSGSATASSTMAASADLRRRGPLREFIGAVATNWWASKFHYAGWHTASISSFPFRHSANWWNDGIMEAMNLMRGFRGERADEVLPGALDRLNRRGAPPTSGSSTSTSGTRTPPTPLPTGTGTRSRATRRPRGTPRRSASATGAGPARTRRRSRGDSRPTSGVRPRRVNPTTQVRWTT